MATAEEARRELARRELARRRSAALAPAEAATVDNGIAPAAPAPQPDTGGYGPQGWAGILEGATGALGAPIDLVNNLIVAPAVSGVNSVFGTDFKADNPLGGSRGLREGMNIPPPSQDVGPQMARRIGQSVGGAAVPLAGTARTVGQAAAGLGTALAGGTGGAVANQLFPDNATADIIGELAGGLAGGGAISAAANRSAQRAAERAVPSVERLKQRAGGLYDQAERDGVTASREQTTQLASDFRKIAESEGLISPTGRVSEAYPKAKEALMLVDDYSKGSMTVPNMKTVRKTLAGAAKSPDDQERRMATIMLDKFDDFTAPLATPLAEARSLYAKAKRGEELETLRALADTREKQFTQSGMDNALRTEYAGLNRKIIKGQERGWSPEQEQAIKRVAEGTRASNAFRRVGAFAPKTALSGISTVGLPYAIAEHVAPGLGPAAAATAFLGSTGAHQIAGKMRSRYAEIAELLARNGGELPAGSNPELQRRIIEALLGSQSAAAQANRP